MKITIPGIAILPDELTGEIPAILIPGTEHTTWFDVYNFWIGLNYGVKSTSSKELNLEFTSDPAFKEKNAFMRVAWWKQLCNTQNSIFGEVEGWAAVWMVSPAVYEDGLVPSTIPNSTYTDEDGGEWNRTWDQWGNVNHEHYYVDNWEYEGNVINDKYLIPTWSWGTNILGTEMDYGQNETGVNLIDRDIFQKCLNQGGATRVSITPTP